MKLTEQPNQDPKSFEFAAFKWLVKRFARPSRRLIVGLTESRNVAITIDGKLICQCADLVCLCLKVEAEGLK